MVILNFHGLGPVTRSVDPAEHACWIDVPHFESILDYISNRPGVQLTFDDGNESDFTLALPALLKRGLKGTFFPSVGFLNRPTYLSSSQIRELHNAGMQLGSHGVNHLPWRKLSSARLIEELVTSRQELEAICSTAIDSAACPFGNYDYRVLKLLKACGYKSVYTSDGGPSRKNSWLQPRNTIRRTTTMLDIISLTTTPPNTTKECLRTLRITAKRLRPSFLRIF